MAPALAETPVTMPFEVPDGYFETPVLSAIRAIDGAQNAEGELIKFPVGARRSPFSLPEGYFEAFPEKIQAKVRQEEAPLRRLTLHNYSWLRVAASILLVLGFYSVWKYLPQNSTERGGATYAENPASNWLPDAVLLSELQLAEAGNQQAIDAGSEENSSVTEFLMDKGADAPSLQGYSIEALQNDLNNIAFTNGG